EQVATRIVATGEAIAFDQPIGPKLNAYRAVNASLLAVEDVLPETPRFDRGAPNPFRTSTVLSFTTTAPGPVRLRLYDLDGRRVPGRRRTRGRGGRRSARRSPRPAPSHSSCRRGP